MSETTTEYKRWKDLPSTHLLGSGTPMCAGCGGLQALHAIYDVLGEKTVFVNAAGCMTLLSVYPFTPFRGSWLYTSMASAPAGAQGIRDALDILLEQKRIPKKEDLDVVVLTGDGAAYGMGLSATSGAMERDLNFIYICYDNEGYGNTGQQYSGATPHAAKTATSKGPRGFAGYKKDLFSIWAAHKPAYLATIIGTEPLDLAQKIEKLKDIKGPRMLITLAPCPTGWEYDPRESIEIGRLAVKSGVWPLKEYMDGKVVHTKMPHPRIPVEEYLEKQGRFSHLFKPKRNKKLLSELQAKVDEYWDNIE
ncbi:MAG TPA: thiamine pyrophosphate-dependent enzyme [Thermodesulfobacteriota bacterium]|nr:thiamine pyrophosphate-dependent enzyme [Thermodesulfobacteriota bacterium]